MSLEEQITELTTAVHELTEAMGGEKPDKKPGKKPGKKPAVKRGKKSDGPSLTDVRNMLRKVSTAMGKDEAVAIMAEFDDATKITEIDAADYAELITACEDALADKNGDEDEDEDL